ncbi:MAG: nuclear transport factor 2 family protein [Frankiales bacterium]|nr:nuclear transport factor 2 family protein [Frankiales bacterium]
MSDDVVLLRALVESYALAVDRADGAAVAGLFVDDGVLALWMDPASGEQTGGRRGRDEVAAAVDGIARYRATHHTISASGWTVDGDTARGETTCTAHHVEPVDDGSSYRDRVLFIRYADDCRRTAGGWRFARREVRVQWVTLLPVDR